MKSMFKSKFMKAGIVSLTALSLSSVSVGVIGANADSITGNNQSDTTNTFNVSNNNGSSSINNITTSKINWDLDHPGKAHNGVTKSVSHWNYTRFYISAHDFNNGLSGGAVIGGVTLPGKALKIIVGLLGVGAADSKISRGIVADVGLEGVTQVGFQ